MDSFQEVDTKVQAEFLCKVLGIQRGCPSSMDTTGTGSGTPNGVIMVTSDVLTYEWIDRRSIEPQEWEKDVQTYVSEYNQGAYGKDLPRDTVADGAQDITTDLIVKQYIYKTRHRTSRFLYGSSVLSFNRPMSACDVYVLMALKGGGRYLLDEVVRYMKEKHSWVHQLILQSVEVPATKRFYKKYGFTSQDPEDPDSVYMKYMLTNDMDTTGVSPGKRVLSNDDDEEEEEEEEEEDNDQARKRQLALKLQSQQFYQQNQHVLQRNPSMFTYEWIFKKDCSNEQEWKEVRTQYLNEYREGLYGTELSLSTVATNREDVIVKQSVSRTRNGQSMKKTKCGLALLDMDPSNKPHLVQIDILMSSEKGSGKFLLDNIMSTLRSKFPIVTRVTLFPVQTKQVVRFYTKYGFQIVPSPHMPNEIDFMKYDLSSTGSGSGRGKERGEGEGGDDPLMVLMQEMDRLQITTTTGAGGGKRLKKTDRNNPVPYEPPPEVPFMWEKTFTALDMEDKIEAKEPYNINPSHQFPGNSFASVLSRRTRLMKPKVVDTQILTERLSVPSYLPQESEYGGENATVHGRYIPQYIRDNNNPDHNTYLNMDTMWFYDYESMQMITHLADKVSIQFLCTQVVLPTAFHPSLYFVYKRPTHNRLLAILDNRDRYNPVLLSLPVPPPLMQVWKEDGYIPLTLQQTISFSRIGREMKLEEMSFDRFNEDTNTMSTYSKNLFNDSSKYKKLVGQTLLFRHGPQSDGSIYLFGAKVPSTHPEYGYLLHTLFQQPSSSIHQYPPGHVNVSRILSSAFALPPEEDVIPFSQPEEEEYAEVEPLPDIEDEKQEIPPIQEEEEEEEKELPFPSSNPETWMTIEQALEAVDELVNQERADKNKRPREEEEEEEEEEKKGGEEEEREEVDFEIDWDAGAEFPEVNNNGDEEEEEAAFTLSQLE